MGKISSNNQGKEIRWRRRKWPRFRRWMFLWKDDVADEGSQNMWLDEAGIKGIRGKAVRATGEGRTVFHCCVASTGGAGTGGLCMRVALRLVFVGVAMMGQGIFGGVPGRSGNTDLPGYLARPTNFTLYNTWPYHDYSQGTDTMRIKFSLFLVRFRHTINQARFNSPASTDQYNCTILHQCPSAARCARGVGHGTLGDGDLISVPPSPRLCLHCSSRFHPETTRRREAESTNSVLRGANIHSGV